MIRETRVGERGSRLRGAGEITRATSNERRSYAEMFVDYDRNCPATSTRLFVATLPVAFQFRVNELAEIYTNPKKASHNGLRRIITTLTCHNLLELAVDVRCTDNWDIRFGSMDREAKSVNIAVGLPVKGAFMVQALETCRCYIVGRDEHGNIFMVDSPRSLTKYGIDPF